MTPAAAVVLNWNQSRMTLDCVAALRAQTRALDRIIVVDNGSRAAERAVLAGLPAGVDRIDSATNRGFAGGMNLGIRAALRGGAGYVWLVNNDAFPEPDCLSALVEAMNADPTLGAVTPRLLRPDGREEHAGGRYDVAADQHTLRSAAELAAPVGGGGHWLNGPAPLVRSAAVRAVGAFDERFFAYWEETDLFFRFARAGYRLRAVPEARAVHIGRASTGGGRSPVAEYLMTRNRALFAGRHAGRPHAGWVVMNAIRKGLHDAGQHARQNRPVLARAAAEAVFAIARREVGPPAGFGRHPRAAEWVTRHPDPFLAVTRLARGLCRPPRGAVR